MAECFRYGTRIISLSSPPELQYKQALPFFLTFVLLYAGYHQIIVPVTTEQCFHIN
ncbi:hypothetical protein EV356DRAFT_510417 [Viridothelium virens]|uniref:Uncharacterized protein n=1 Tax=Viridothelium virens TaxID=1048519 RepID=A0A6A6GV43_VIRVR|nr:hypothetical protein EV356DRAFT_510417 [Viridothelium virens]